MTTEREGDEGKISFLKNERKGKVRQFAREMKIKNRQSWLLLFCCSLRETEILGNKENAVNQQISLFCWEWRDTSFKFL